MAMNVSALPLCEVRTSLFGRASVGADGEQKSAASSPERVRPKQLLSASGVVRMELVVSTGEA
eukprot:7072719-Prorocentrum_lima.AAC.1